MNPATNNPASAGFTRKARALVIVLVSTLITGCTGYYLQAVAGQAALMNARRPIEEVLADPATPPGLRQRLLAADSALLFARLSLGLPSSGSYRHYADLGRPYVVWNVVAAPEFSLEPREWCYPVAGCASYRGWFSEARASGEAAALAARGYDVFVGGVPAYSTLGWFADPLLNTMFHHDDAGVAGLLFHELAHQKVYVSGDTAFNEGFASFVEEEGTRRWLVSRNDADGLCRFEQRLARRAEVLGILGELRTGLAAIYASTVPVEQRREARAAAFERARAAYAALRAGWDRPPWFDSWFAPGLNNARLAALLTYEEQVPAFRALLALEGGNLERFYARVEALSHASADEREQLLRRLGPPTDAPPVSVSAAAGSGCRDGY